MEDSDSRSSERSASDGFLNAMGMSDISVYNAAPYNNYDDLSSNELDPNNLELEMSPVSSNQAGDSRYAAYNFDVCLPKPLFKPTAENEDSNRTPTDTPCPPRVKSIRKRGARLNMTEESSSDSFSDKGPRRRNLRRSQEEWSHEEDNMLKKYVHDYNKQNWPAIARQVHKAVPGSPLRTPSQCNQRWSRVVDPSIKKGKWSQHEDEMLINAIRCSPPRKWRLIADKIRGRTDIQVRYRLKAIGDDLVARGIIGPQYLPE